MEKFKAYVLWLVVIRLSIYCVNFEVGFRVRLNEHELEQIPGESGGQRSLACCSREVVRSQTRFCSLATEQQALL